LRGQVRGQPIVVKCCEGRNRFPKLWWARHRIESLGQCSRNSNSRGLGPNETKNLEGGHGGKTVRVRKKISIGTSRGGESTKWPSPVWERSHSA
jgi:hypothetical protein